MNKNYLLDVEDLVALYGYILTSVNNIWNIYIFVLLGMVGWIVARTSQFNKRQRLMLSSVFIVFNSVVIFYFRDAYQDMKAVIAELGARQALYNLETVQGGMSLQLLGFSPDDRFVFVASFIGLFGLAILFAIWSKIVWCPVDEARDAEGVSETS